jgi:hypothetical protein
MFKTRFAVIRDAIQVLLHHLKRLPPSDKAEQLNARVQDCMRDAEQASASPSDREQDAIMKRLLLLHVDVTKLERGVCVASAKASECQAASYSTT